MPLFFFISGFLHKNRLFKDGIKQDCRKIVVPYFLLCLTSYPFLLFDNYSAYPQIFQMRPISTLLQNIEWKPVEVMILGVNVHGGIYISRVTRFLYAMFITKLIHYLFIKISGNSIWKYIALNVVFLYIIYIFNKYTIVLSPYQINQAIRTYPFLQPYLF